MKKILIFLTILAVLIGCYYWKFKLKNPSQEQISSSSVELSCDDGSTMTVQYSKPDENGIMTRLALAVINGDTRADYDMYPAMAASGAKFETKDLSYSLWEHQGEFTFASGETTITVCREKEVAVNTMTEMEAREIAEATCIKGGESLSEGMFNENSKTWWFDANLNATQPGCNPACVVSEEDKTAEINWRCTGLLTK